MLKRAFIGNLLSDLAASALGDTLKQFAAAAATGNGSAVAAVVGGLTGGPLLAIGILAAGVALQVSGGRKEKKEEAEAWAALTARLDGVKDDQSALADLLTECAEKPDHFLARLPGFEKADLARWVADEVKKAIEAPLGGADTKADWQGLRIYLNDIHQRLADLAGAVAEVRGAVAEVHTEVREIKDVLTTGRAQLPAIPQGIKDNLAVEGITPNTDFVGRTDLLARVHGSLTAGQTAALTHALSADGGVGKTEIAIAYVFKKDYTKAWRGVWWLDASETGFDSSLERLLRHVGCARQQGQTTADLWCEFVRRIGEERHLVVFDNVEKGAFLRDFVVPPTSRVLATTRLSAENLGQATVLDVAVLARDDAKRLLVMHRADLRDQANDGLPTAAHERAIDAIAAHLGDHALAIALAAAALRYDRGLSPANLLARLQESEVGGDEDPLSDVGEDQTGRRYEKSVAEALLLHLPALERAAPGARRVLLLASLCHSEAIPFPLIAACLKAEEEDGRRAVLALRDRSMIKFEAAAGVEGKGLLSVHRLTQSAMRARAGADHLAGAAEALRTALLAIFDDPEDVGAWPRQAEALPHARAVLARRAAAGAGADWATLRNQVGRLLSQLGRAAEAEPLYQEALEMNRRLFTGDHPDVARSLNNLASVKESLGRAAEAEPLFHEALDMYRRLFEGDHPDVATSLNNLASVKESRGRADEAEPLFQKALEMRRRLFKGDHPDVAASLNNLASVKKSRGRAAEAEPLYQQALDMYRRLFADDHPDVATSLNNLASVKESLGRAAEAEPLYQQALEMRRRLFKGDHPDVATSLNNLAVCQGRQGRWAEALALLEEAVAMARRCLPAGHPDLVAWEANLAYARRQLGGG